jgi:hypothetical protein
MADWAGAYGAGGAADALQQLVAQKFLERKQAELERAQRVQEAQAQAEMAQRGDHFRQSQQLQLTNLAADRDERYQDRTQRVGETNTRLQRETLQDQIRAKERTEDHGARAAEREDDQAFRNEERKGRQSFEALMASRTSGAPASEPLVAIKDTSAPGGVRLVRRSQAEGQAPASTRDQALTEGQSNAAGFADRMKFNEAPIQAYESAAAASVGGRLASILPRDMQSKERQSYDAAKKNWIASQLRKESGAAISDGEYAEAERQYFPQPGDDPALIKQKRELRKLAETSMRRSSGHAAGVSLDPQPAQGGGSDDLGKEW